MNGTRSLGIGPVGAFMPGEDVMEPAPLVSREMLQAFGPSLLSRMREADAAQQQRWQAGERSPTPMTEDRAWLADDVAGSLLGPMGIMGAIKAYHGSPHRFDRFDMSKIGTGEGAQAYGHGLYFAEEPAVAKGYQKMLEGTVDPQFFDGMSLIDESSVKHIFDVAEEGMTNQQIIGRIQRNIMEDYAARKKLEDADPNTFRGQLLRDVERVISEKEHAMSVVAERGHLLKKRGSGSLYTARLDVEPEDLLDWDAPLSQQSEKVQRALMNLPNAHKFKPEWTGAQLYEASLLVPGDVRDKKAATAVLQKAGIPGIRYLDQGSRASGEGTRNFVIFDDKLIDIEGVE